MEQKLKNTLEELREKISKLEKNQKELKPQRKTVHFKGERTVDPWEAKCKVDSNKEYLRILYATYNLLRGKGFDITENKAKPLNSETYYKQTGYSLPSKLEGRHPLFLYLEMINDVLNTYGYTLKYEEVRKENIWGKTYSEKEFDFDNYEQVICIGE